MSNTKSKDVIDSQLYSGWKAQNQNFSFERESVPRTPHTEPSPFAQRIAKAATTMEEAVEIGKNAMREHPNGAENPRRVDAPFAPDAFNFS